MTLVKTLLMTAFATVLLVGNAAAATYSYAGAVTATNGPATAPGDPDFPAIGTPGTVTLDIDDTNPGLAWLDGFDVVQAFSASVLVPGYVAGSMLNDPNPTDYFEVTTEFLAFGAYGPTSIVDPGAEIYLPNGRHSFRVYFGETLDDAPTTIGGIVSALNAPGASGFFSHELESGFGGFDFTRVEFPAEVPEVPLPASAWLMIAALGGLRCLRRTA